LFSSLIYIRRALRPAGQHTETSRDFVVFLVDNGLKKARREALSPHSRRQLSASPASMAVMAIGASGARVSLAAVGTG
jgi:hypothetical protein